MSVPPKELAPEQAPVAAAQMLSPPGESVESGDGREPSAKLQCDSCDRAFTRPSHLNRHQLTHLPASRRNIIPCPRCGRSFSRHDVLLRHLRAAHDVELGAKSTYQKSCHRCVQKKLKCDRELPCRACSVATTKVMCEYPSNEPSPDVKLSPGSSVPDRTLIDNAVPHPDIDTAGTPRSATDSSSSSNPRIEADFAALPTAPSPSIVEPHDPSLFATNGFNPAFPGAGEPTPMPAAFPFNPTFAQPARLDFRQNGFDWLSFEMPDANLSMDCGWGGTGLGTDLLLSNPLGPNLAATETSRILEHRPAILPWPFDPGHETAASRCPLPSLREVLKHTVRQSPGPENPALEGMAQLFSEHYLPPRGDLLDPNTSLGLELLKSLIDHFFAGFQIIQPMVHTGTWNMAECPTMMLAAMACIGAVLSNQPDAAELASSISDFCLRMINWLGFSDIANYSNISYLTTLCLHQIYSLGSGNRQLYQNADRTRGVLIGSLRGLDLLTSRLRLQTEAETMPRLTLDNPSTLYSEWTSWVDHERDRRVVWASFEYDCSLCTLTGRRGVVDLSELPAALPCVDALWEAQSPHAWAVLRSRATPNEMGAPLSTVIQSVIAGQLAPEGISVWGLRICSQTVGRLLWDLKQLETLSGKVHFGLSSLFNAHQQSKAPLLLGLDGLLASMNQPATTSDLVSYNISGLLCHYSHLYAAEDIMDIVLYIVRNVVSRGSRHDPGVDLARRRLSETFASDPQRSRRLLWHAGQIVAIANDYLVSAPCEIMRLFMGYIFIITFAKYCPRWPPVKGVTVHLDFSGHTANQKTGVADWIQRGGTAKMGSSEDIFANGATLVIAQDAQAMLLRLRCWGLSEKFTKIVQSFEASDK